MAIQPQEAGVAPDAVFTQTPPAPPTPQPDSTERHNSGGTPALFSLQHSSVAALR